MDDSFMTTDEEKFEQAFGVFIEEFRKMFKRIGEISKNITENAVAIDQVSEELAGTDKSVSRLNDRLSRVERSEHEVDVPEGAQSFDMMEWPEGRVVGRGHQPIGHQVAASVRDRTVDIGLTEAERALPFGAPTSEQDAAWIGPRCGHGYKTFVRSGQVVHVGSGGLCAGASIDPGLIEPEKRDHPFVPGVNFVSNCGQPDFNGEVCGWDASNHTSVSEPEYERRVRHWAKGQLMWSDELTEGLIRALKAAPGFPITGREGS